MALTGDGVLRLRALLAFVCLLFASDARLHGVHEGARQLILAALPQRRYSGARAASSTPAAHRTKTQ